MKEMLWEVRCLKSNEDMIFALAGQFKQLSHEPGKFRLLNGICFSITQLVGHKKAMTNSAKKMYLFGKKTK